MARVRRGVNEQAIRDAYILTLKAAQARDVEPIVSIYADDASIFPPNAPIVAGKEAVRAFWVKWFSDPNFVPDWETTLVEVSRAGDLGYSIGTYEITFSDPNGKPMTDRGKWLATWRKYPDRSWKLVADIFNSDLPLPAPGKH